LALLAAAAVVMLLGQRGVEASPLRRVAAHAQPPVRARALPLFALAFFFYVAVESTSTGWIASQLHGVGFSTATGSLVTALFWTTFAMGRSLGGWLHRFTPSRVVLVGLVGATLLVPFADVHVVAPFIWPLVGVLIASTWVFGLLWYQQLVGHDPEGFNRIMLTAMLGGVAGPSLTSFVVSLVGVHAVPFMLALFAALDATLFFVALRFNRD
jgi:fucose permease